MEGSTGEQMGGKTIVRRRREEANRQGWKCHWCQIPMTEVPLMIPPGMVLPPTMVTLDHLFAKGDPRRRIKPRNGEKRYVAACFECNHRRGKEHEKTIFSSEQLHSRSGRFPSDRFTKPPAISTPRK